jgi:hypothetical protein
VPGQHLADGRYLNFTAVEQAAARGVEVFVPPREKIVATWSALVYNFTNSQDDPKVKMGEPTADDWIRRGGPRRIFHIVQDHEHARRRK